ncbi:MAG: DUF2975 domain-containing protein [Bacteroidetes bacterium]|nr:DUF2975 domain-containing protein [Bacteroidota bacterium]MCC7515244.1 DUF2975 domain-containing protein [Bacteroidia bacterium]MCW5920551.1 DUF2975 domain-containing protein [Bacteroidota bacterium]HCI58582.1 DUF2975 domain-containing protein [Bacteroidota bacterium]HMW09256.1 DUF2975 domain-containing protein [Bacteroidia bacterium]
MANTRFIFQVLHVIAWIFFVGLCIEAGGIIVNFVFSIYNPEFVSKLYQKLDLSELYNRSKWIFFSMYSFIIVIALLKVLLFYTVIMLLLKLDLSKPFSSFVSSQISQISYYTLSIGIMCLIAAQTTKNLDHHGYDVERLYQFWNDGKAFILMSAVVYVISTIFKKGVELQKENDLTV